MISVVLGVALPWIPGLRIPGIFVAAIPFPEGIHSDHAELFFVLAMTIDFVIYAGLSYWLLTICFSRNPKTRE